MAEAEELDLTVLFGRVLSRAQQGEGFGLEFEWDVPLLGGYKHAVLETAAFLRRPSFFRSRIRNLTATLRAIAPDAVLVTGWNEWTLVQAALEARSMGVPVIVRGDSNAQRPRSIVTNAAHRMLMRLYDAFLVVGKSNAQFYRSAGVPAERMFEALHFSDNKRFGDQAGALAVSRSSLRDRWEIPADRTCYLFAGKLTDVKRLPDFLNAIARSRPAPIYGLVVGAGEGESEARRYANELKLPVTFTGFLNQSEIAGAYVAADVLVLASNYETWGLVVNEAMACGRPAFVSDRVGCGPDLVMPGQTGEVFRFGDVPALAELMRRYAGQPGELARMGAAARERVTREYSVEKSVQGVLKAVEFVLSRGKQA